MSAEHGGSQYPVSMRSAALDVGRFSEAPLTRLTPDGVGTLTPCRDCAHLVSPEAFFCPACGRHLRFIPPRLLFACPDCGSDDTVRLRSLYEHGTSILTARTGRGGIGLGRGVSFTVGRARTGGEIQTLASKAAAPPRLPLGGAMAPHIGVMFALGALYYWEPSYAQAVIAGYALYTVYAVWWFLAARPGLLRQWNQTWTCRRCAGQWVGYTASEAEDGDRAGLEARVR